MYRLARYRCTGIGPADGGDSINLRRARTF